MGDANVRRPVATRFEHGVDFGLLVHKSPFMADKRDPLVLSNYIFELLEVNPGVAGFLIQLHTEDVDAVVESVTAHAEKGAGTKTTLYVGQEEEEEEVEEEEEDAGGVGAGGRKEKPHNPLMISVQKVRVRPGKGKGKSDGWFPQPLTHNTRRVCTDDPENKLPMHSLCPTREWEREWYGVTTPNIISGQGVILFPFGATPPLIGEAEEVVAAEPLGAFNRDPNDLVLTVGGKLVVNHLLEHDFLSDIQLQSLLDDLDRVSAKLLQHIPRVGFGLTGVACPHPSPTSLCLPLWVRGRFLFLQSTLRSCQCFGCLLHCILPSCQHLIAVFLTAHLLLAPIPCLHHPGRLASPCHFILFKRAIKLMVASMNCSEGSPLRIYPCTSEVQSVTQGTKERFAKNYVARSDFPISFLFGSHLRYTCAPKGAVGKSVVEPAPMHSLEHNDALRARYRVLPRDGSVRTTKL